MISTGRIAGIATCAVTLALVLGGCVSFNPRSVRAVESAVIAENPELVIASRMTFGVGALTLDFIDLAFVHDARIDLSKISRADVGVFELASHRVFDTFRMPEASAGGRHCPQRDVIVRIREADEQVQVSVCLQDERVTGVEVIVLEPREFVVINARGDFAGLIDSLVRSSVQREKDAREVSTRGHAVPEPASVDQRIAAAR